MIDATSAWKLIGNAVWDGSSTFKYTTFQYIATQKQTIIEGAFKIDYKSLY